MDFSRRTVLGMAIAGGGVAVMARAQAATAPAAYVVTYLETGAAEAQAAAALLRQAAATSRRAAGNLFAYALEESGRPSRFALIAGWRDADTLAAHQRAEAASGLATKVGALLVSPPDRRPSTALSVAPAAAAPTTTAVYVVTHADIVPPAKAQAIPVLEQLAGEARRDSGNLWFDVFYQNSRPNHFTLFEAWRSPQAFDAYRRAAGTRVARQKVLPMQGALYDERVYRALG
ncbi:MAG: putative quinol monooxygenase [Stellaceae bacterium]